MENRTELDALMRARPGVDVTTVADVLLAYISTRPAWMAEAACRGVGPDLFYVSKGQPVAPARALCASCPVRDDCYQYALDTDAEGGIWGGATSKERRAIHSSGRRTA